MLILGFVDVPLFLVLIPCVALLLYIYGTAPLGKWKRLGVDGPTGYPFMGNVPSMFDRKRGLRHCLKQWQAKYGRMYGIIMYRKPVLVVSDLEGLKQILVKDFNNFVDRITNYRYIQRIIQKGLFFSGSSDWRRIRRIVTPTFSSGKLKSLVHHMNRTAGQLASRLERDAEEGREVEAKQVFAAFSLDVIASTAFGLDLDSQANPDNLFMAHAKSLMTIKSSVKITMAVTGLFPALGRLVGRLFNFGFFKRDDIEFFENQMYSLLKERKANPEQFQQPDFIQLLMESEADASDDIVGSKKLSLEEVAAQCIIFIIAGYETSSTVLQFLAYKLARHPEVQSKLVAEIREVIGDDEVPSYDACQKLKYMEAVLNEILRMYPPLHYILRESNYNKTVDVQGIPVPPQTRIMIPIYVMGRDPDNFEDPDTFNPDRFLGANKTKMDAVSFIPFGFGPRQCVGMRMAMLQLKIALVHVMRKVSIISATPEILDMLDFTAVMVPKDKIKLKLARLPSSKSNGSKS